MEGRTMNWKLVLVLTVAVTAGQFAVEAFFHRLDPLLITLTAVATLFGGTLRSLALHIGKRKKDTTAVARST
jgi:hypothetical protein